MVVWLSSLPLWGSKHNLRLLLSLQRVKHSIIADSPTFQCRLSQLPQPHRTPCLLFLWASARGLGHLVQQDWFSLQAEWCAGYVGGRRGSLLRQRHLCNVVHDEPSHPRYFLTHSSANVWRIRAQVREIFFFIRFCWIWWDTSTPNLLQETYFEQILFLQVNWFYFNSRAVPIFFP